MMIHQLQASYLIAQDRLLLRLNTQTGEELRLWLTRRMVKKLFARMLKVPGAPASPSMPLESHDGDGPPAARSGHQAAQQPADFQTPFKAQATTLPIGEEPLLATTVHVTNLDGGSLRVGFEEKIEGSKGSRSFEVTLGPQLLHGFMHLLEFGLQQADWGLALSRDGDHRTLSALDVFASAEPPRYLN